MRRKGLKLFNMKIKDISSNSQLEMLNYDNFIEYKICNPINFGIYSNILLDNSHTKKKRSFIIRWHMTYNLISSKLFQCCTHFFLLFLHIKRISIEAWYVKTFLCYPWVQYVKFAFAKYGNLFMSAWNKKNDINLFSLWNSFIATQTDFT